MQAEAILRAVLERQGLIPAATRWAVLAGGRSNALWRVQGGGVDLVCKLYRPARGNALFPNEAEAEAVALQALAGTELAPPFLGKADSPLGVVILYGFVPGTHGEVAPQDVARALGRLHGLPQRPELRRTGSDPAEIAKMGRFFLEGNRESRLAEMLPEVPPLPPASSCLIHGDAVPANIIASDSGPVFIDWQCPALGDAAEDLAIYLSPAMQQIYGSGPLTEAQQAAFLAAYPDAETAARYRALAPLFHWRMAAYCDWKARRGEAEYARARDLEIAALEG
ncbi:aminoglycoside phosphotransferase family protein [Pseudoruegeria sp. SHC-113]|uniref:aminoglycoside phosphotransferase family protein n=1 Tax=Pseudoruegeria sp. SHC-113 TaxID=2855439 RepID=UPI0021BB546A|nr:aminoglycoside phosphotransferase family protein [Pseudoruegeria sp. SHC-113]MCT8158649.1 aminoglycoside phosphotransferase family protein [Pseudoruegeria sp. SHC-113]